jgi:hypothetical protein
VNHKNQLLDTLELGQPQIRYKRPLYQDSKKQEIKWIPIKKTQSNILLPD